VNIFRTKSIALLKEGAEAHSLKKTLGALDLVLLGIGCIVGTGIFVLTGVAAAKYAGPGIMLSFVISGLTCAFAALAYAELAAMVPVTGSAYTFTYAAIGEIVAWIVGWNLILEYTVGSSAVAAGWSGYMVGLLKSGGINLPLDFTAVPADGGIVNLPAMFITLFLTCLLVRGTKESAKLNKILVFIKLAAVFIFLLLAGPRVNPVNWSPFMPFGFSGVVGGAAIIFFAYIGFDSVATAAEECRNPSRDLPIGIIGSLVVCTILYIAVAAVLTGVVPYQQLNNAEPVAYALRTIGYNMGSALVGTGAICGITTVLLVFMYGQSRVFFAMSRDGLIPASICKIHPKYGTPHLVTMIAGVVVSLIAGFAPIGMIAELTNIGTLFAFLIAAIGVLVLRHTQPNAERPFRCPAITIIAPLAVIFCGYLMLNLPETTWLRFAIWSAAGFAIYFIYSYHHSTLSQSKMPTAKDISSQ
jgi:APA family basic amino acid/polyamine antiporter